MHAPSKQLSDEQWAKVGDPNISPKLKRQAGTIALLGVILGVMALGGLLFSLEKGFSLRAITLASPPSVISASFAFFAIGFGIVALWSVKQIPGRAGVRCLAVLALVLGLIGPPIYAYQALQIHKQLQQGEVARAYALTQAALSFHQKQGRFPADLLELVQSAHLGPESVKTTFSRPNGMTAIPQAKRTDADYDTVLRNFENESDYVYTAGNITVPIPTALSATVIIARGKHAQLESQSAAVGFADGSARWVSLDDAKQLYEADDAARQKMGAASRPAVTPATGP